MKTGARASGNPRPRGVRAWRRTLDAEAAPAPAMCCLAAGTSRDQSALAEVRSMVARTKVADCGQTGAEGLSDTRATLTRMIFSFCNCIKLLVV